VTVSPGGGRRPEAPAAAPASRLAEAFARRRPDDLPGLVPYVTAGFPHRDDTPALLAAAERAGCLAAEVGIPFSDPLADGPTIQRTSQQALANGMSVARGLAAVAAARDRGLTLPVALMTYVNPVMAFGLERFCAEAAAAGAEAVIVPDLPADESAELREAADAAGLALILLVAPTTTPARLEAACRRATGFVYCVSVTGITGARDRVSQEAIDLLMRVRAVTDLPRALGFGLSRHDHLRALRGRAEAAVVGSALLDRVGSAPGDPAGAAERFLRELLEGRS
jgi:tryptophan synthase alpha chain